MHWFQGYNNVLPIHQSLLPPNISLPTSPTLCPNYTPKHRQILYNHAATPIRPAANPKVTPLAVAAPVDCVEAAPEPVVVGEPEPVTAVEREADPPVDAAVGRSVTVTPCLAQRPATTGAISADVVSYRVEVKGM
jgi:hypothetical protein